MAASLTGILTPLGNYAILPKTNRIGKGGRMSQLVNRMIRAAKLDANLYEDSLRQQILASRAWHLSEDCPSAYPHKCFVMGKLFESAQRNGLKAVPRRIIQYSGDKDAIMLHYQFQITPVTLGSPVPVDNRLSIVDIMNYPVEDWESSESPLTRILCYCAVAAAIMRPACQQRSTLRIWCSISSRLLGSSICWKCRTFAWLWRPILNARS